MTSRLITQVGNNVGYSKDKKSIIGVLGQFDKTFKTGVASKDLKASKECVVDEQSFKDTNADNVIMLINADTEQVVGRSDNGLFELMVYKDKIAFKLDIAKLQSDKFEFQRSIANDILTMVKQNKVKSTSMIIQDEQSEKKGNVDYIKHVGKIKVISINQ
ncbi:HK97 family phage prohead protease [Mammaliicoccus sciuri]